MEIKNIDIVIPSFRSKELISLAIKSFEKYRGNFNFKYIVVENSNDTSYKEHVLSLSPDVLWVQNLVPSWENSNSPYVGSEANASGLEKGLESVQAEYVFLIQNDVVACRDDWMSYLVSKINDEVPMVTVRENFANWGAPWRQAAGRIACTVGILVKTSIAKSVSMWPSGTDWDCGDELTRHCFDNGLNFFACQNTASDESLIEKIQNDEYRNLPGVERVLNDNYEVIFMHLGRGAEKTLNRYRKPNKMLIPGWVKFVNENVL